LFDSATIQDHLEKRRKKEGRQKTPTQTHTCPCSKYQEQKVTKKKKSGPEKVRAKTCAPKRKGEKKKKKPRTSCVLFSPITCSSSGTTCHTRRGKCKTEA